MKFSDNVINEVADNLDIGFISYIHKTTHEITQIIDLDDPFADSECWEDQLNYIEENRADLIRVAPMKSYQDFNIMKEFAYDEVADSEIAAELKEALQKRKPFRKFGDAVFFHGVREQWFKYKNAQYVEWVKITLAEHVEA